MKNILVTGGAGYIGSHTCHMLVEQGHNVVVIDSMEYGHKEALPSDAKLYVGNLADTKLLNRIFTENEIDAVVHFAAYAYVGESMENPAKYFNNNIVNGLNLLNAIKEHKIENIVFSSSCAVYGEPKSVPIREDCPKNPTNYYGLTKLMFEQFLDAYEVYGLKSVCLRYFNAAGAGYKIGEDHDPETHLIPLILDVALEKRAEIKVFGTDYPTPDGSCVRDYIHVLDLADAHVRALGYLFDKNESLKVNLGTGNGSSVKEIIDLCKKVTGKPISVIETDRREGDPAKLVAFPKKAEKVLGWKSKYSIEDIIKSAWNWHNSHPGGFE